MQAVQFALADSDKSRLQCKDARYDATQRFLHGLAVSERLRAYTDRFRFSRR